MEFNEFRELQQQHFDNMVVDSHLFIVDVDPDELWELYLDSFPPGTNEIFRERREYDCSCCRNFVRQFGNVVSIDKNNNVTTIWDFEVDDYKFSSVVEAMGDFVWQHAVRDVHITKQKGFGTDRSLEMLEDGTVRGWDHFHLELPKRLVTKSSKSEAELMGQYRDSKNVFQRSLEEITQDAVETVLDLIWENVLYRGEEWENVLQKFLELHKEYHTLEENHDEFCWRQVVEQSGALTRIRNHSIGTLLNDLSDGMEVTTALKRYEKVVAPTNYKRPKAVFTCRMVEQAEQTVGELGLLDSLPRRHATLDDISVNNVLWASRDAQNHMGGRGGIFEALKKDISVNSKNLKCQPVNVEDFVEGILPSAHNVEVLFENRHEKNLTSLIAPVYKSESLFKWDNGFSWAYNGNIADSMREQVKAAGGSVDGVLRFSLRWNDRGFNGNDYDAHCVEPNGNRIFFRNARSVSGGELDVDIIDPTVDQVAVENITWPHTKHMEYGVYKFYIHNYTHRGGRDGFDCEIEFDGEIYSFEYHYNLKHKESVLIAEVEYSKDGFKIVNFLESTVQDKEVWNLKTNRFHPASAFMFSPNHWDGEGIGNRHYMFMLADCVNPDSPNGFFNEYLRNDLLEHKRVFEALGRQMRVEPSDYQLSGIGFSSTKRDSVICKVDGRLFKVIF